MKPIKKPAKQGEMTKLSFSPNKQLLFIIIGLMIFGLVMVLDASVYIATSTFNDELYFAKQHLVWIVIGLVVAIPAFLIDYRRLKPVIPFVFIANVLLLLAVLVFGEAVNGSKRWITVGPMPIQPAEFIKPVIVLFLAAYFAANSDKEVDEKSIMGPFFTSKLIKFLAIVVPILVLIVIEPDLGTTLIVAITAFSIFVVSGTTQAHKINTMIVAFVGFLFAGAAAIIAPYRFERVKTYLEILQTGRVPDSSGEGYQMFQIIIGIAAAGWKGVGFGQSRQRFGWLVENTAHTDSIFAVYLEELGFIGALLLIGIWVIFFVIGMNIAKNAQDKFGSFLAVGLTTWLVSQAFLNMAANVGLIPLTGLPLPFFTYGGSNTIVTLVGAALLLNVSREAIKSKVKRVKVL